MEHAAMPEVICNVGKLMFPTPNYIEAYLDKDLQAVIIKIHIMNKDFPESYKKLGKLDDLYKDKDWYGFKIICTFEEIEDGIE